MPVTGNSTWDKISRTAKDFGDFLRDNGVRNISEIRQDDYQAYIRDKVEGGAKDSSCQAYISHLQRVEQARSMYTGQERQDLGGLRAYAHEHADRSAQYPSRAYPDPEAVIAEMKSADCQGYAALQYGLGSRFNGIQGLTARNFKGIEVNPATGQEMGVVLLNGKGQDYTNRFVPVEVYEKAREYVQAVGTVHVGRTRYNDEIREACHLLGVNPGGSHAFRHNAAQDSYAHWAPILGPDAAKSIVSETLGHHRPEITETYLR